MHNVVITLLAIFALLFYIYFKKTFRYWKDRNVVSLPVIPILGSYGKVMSFRKHVALIMKDIYDKYPQEKYIGGFKGYQPQLIVLDPDVIRSIMVKDFSHFCDKNFEKINHVLDEHLLNLRGDRWRSLRQKLTPMFTSSKLKLMFPLISKCAEDLDKYVNNSLERSDVLEVKEIMVKYTTDTIGSCMFGIDVNILNGIDRNETFIKIGHGIMKFSFYRAFVREMTKITPQITKIIPNLKVRSPKTDNFIINLVKELINKRGTPSNRHDFIDSMMELKRNVQLSIDKDEHNGEVLEITDEFIAAQARLYFAAGFETSSSTMSYALRELALNPSVQEKLVNEIDSVLKKSDGRMTYDAIKEMHYLDMVISETLRKYPLAPNLDRYCNAKYRIPNTDIILDEGVLILIPVYALQHDPKYFKNPDEFIPERFLKDAENPIHPFTYLPFGDGPRNCIGMRFGKLQVKTGLITVLSKYKFEKCDKTIVKNNFAASIPLLSSIGGLWLKVTRRSKE